MIDTVGDNSACMEALSRQYEAIAHNLANSNTAGYKRLVMEFARGDAPPAEGTGTTTPAPGTSPAIVGRTFIDFTQGAMVQTGRPMDVGLHGKGFLVLETPEGSLYTRNGTLQTNVQGQLVDSSGRTVAGQGGPIIIPPDVPSTSISVSPDGRIIAGRNEIGRLRIVEFEKPAALVPAGQCAFRAPAGVAPTDAANTTVQQGFQESSNVSVVDELVGLITVSRLYEANVNVMRSRSDNTKTLLQVAVG
jgi:flagellar basal-body rod protein FlgF